jgi:hypothetical protein
MLSDVSYESELLGEGQYCKVFPAPSVPELLKLKMSADLVEVLK